MRNDDGRVVDREFRFDFQQRFEFGIRSVLFESEASLRELKKTIFVENHTKVSVPFGRVEERRMDTACRVDKGNRIDIVDFSEPLKQRPILATLAVDEAVGGLMQESGRDTISIGAKSQPDRIQVTWQNLGDTSVFGNVDLAQIGPPSVAPAVDLHRESNRFGTTLWRFRIHGRWRDRVRDGRRPDRFDHSVWLVQ